MAKAKKAYKVSAFHSALETIKAVIDEESRPLSVADYKRLLEDLEFEIESRKDAAINDE